MKQFSLCSKPEIMGILNVTPDSFYDGGHCVDVDSALQSCESMIKQGVDIIDLGGESSRPGAQSISPEEELARVQPVLIKIKEHFDIRVSIDTRNPLVMQACLEIGADWINDIQALQSPGALDTVAHYKPNVCLMHMQGTPQVMQNSPKYVDVVEQVLDFLKSRVQACLDVGLSKDQLLVDPGFGFGKKLNHNLALLNHLNAFKSLGARVLVGLSRKSMFGEILNLPVQERLNGSLSAASIAVYHGADVLRVHSQDVRATKECALVAHELRQALQGKKYES